MAGSLRLELGAGARARLSRGLAPALALALASLDLAASHSLGSGLAAKHKAARNLAHFRRTMAAGTKWLAAPDT